MGSATSSADQKGWEFQDYIYIEYSFKKYACTLKS